MHKTLTIVPKYCNLKFGQMQTIDRGTDCYIFMLTSNIVLVFYILGSMAASKSKCFKVASKQKDCFLSKVVLF